MKIYVKELTYTTSRREELINITKDVEKVVLESGIKNGIVLVYVPHATAALVVNEDESGLKQDILNKVLELFPREGNYLHNRIDDNANAHLASTFLSTFKIFPLVNGKLIRGTWQEIMLLDMDGPRTRRVIVEVLGE